MRWLKYKTRYPGKVAITKIVFQKTPEEGEMTSKQKQTSDMKPQTHEQRKLQYGMEPHQAHSINIMSHHVNMPSLYNFDHLKPHYNIVKRWFTGVTLFFLFFFENIDCGYSLEPPRRGGSKIIYVLSRDLRNIRAFFLSENVQFLEVKFSLYLNIRVT